MGGALRSNPMRRWRAPRPICGCSASPPAASTSPRVRWRRRATAQPDGQAQPIAIARFFAETLATAAPGLKETVIAGADATLALTPEAFRLEIMAAREGPPWPMQAVRTGRSGSALPLFAGTTIGSVASFSFAPTFEPASGFAWTIAGWFAFGYLFFQTLFLLIAATQDRPMAFQTQSLRASLFSPVLPCSPHGCSGTPSPLTLSAQRVGFPVGDVCGGILRDSVDTHGRQPPRHTGPGRLISQGRRRTRTLPLTPAPAPPPRCSRRGSLHPGQRT